MPIERPTRREQQNSELPARTGRNAKSRLCQRYEPGLTDRAGGHGGLYIPTDGIGRFYHVAENARSTRGLRSFPPGATPSWARLKPLPVACHYEDSRDLIQSLDSTRAQPVRVRPSSSSPGAWPRTFSL